MIYNVCSTYTYILEHHLKQEFMCIAWFLRFCGKVNIEVSTRIFNKTFQLFFPLTKRSFLIFYVRLMTLVMPLSKYTNISLFKSNMASTSYLSNSVEIASPSPTRLQLATPHNTIVCYTLFHPKRLIEHTVEKLLC